jgi:phosphatidylserine decarboxylase
MYKVPVAKEGIWFIVIPVCLGLPFLFTGMFWLGIILFLPGIFCAYFFRDPERVITDDKALVLCPADGRVMEICEEDGCKVIRIFMSVLNVHIQRAPFSGVIKSVEHKPGRFLHAMSPNACVENEQNIITIYTDNGEYKIKQIAGILARRIVCCVKPGDSTKKGDRIGMIRFGSQVDITCPVTVEITVRPGERVVGGKTVIGKLEG